MARGFEKLREFRHYLNREGPDLRQPAEDVISRYLNVEMRVIERTRQYGSGGSHDPDYRVLDERTTILINITQPHSLTERDRREYLQVASTRHWDEITTALLELGPWADSKDDASGTSLGDGLPPPTWR